jgi:hypothetical protein
MINFTTVFILILFLIAVIGIIVSRQKKPKWNVDDEIFIWMSEQIEGDTYGVHPAYGKITKKFKNGKYNVYLYATKKTIKVEESELRS